MTYFDQTSERLSFRKLTAEDIPAWTEFFVDNISMPYLGIDVNLSKETLARNWITGQFERYEKKGLGHLAAIDKISGEFIGLGGIIPRLLEGRNEYEIAYSLFPKFWGKGYGTELAKKMKDYGIKNIETERFISIIDKENHPSAHVAEKNGMKVLFETNYLGMDVNVYGINI
ncbi:MAG: ribosomal-protein-alanine N-acetyltransferase [Glaciecola sp.]|jgi:ribosomal-protein-alanine N-acetyltransferase